MTNIFRKLAKLVIDREYRAMAFMNRFNSSRVQQTTQLTMENRYPEEFETVKQYFDAQGKKDIRILSYGCCTGEEVLTLRRYFPDATIVGAEINMESLRICRQREVDDKILFIKSTPRNIHKYAPFDAVFAMAVLERLPRMVEDKGITDLSEMYPYDKYVKQVNELDSYLKKDGIFASSFTHYYILDTPLKQKYEVYSDCTFVGNLFGTDNKLIGRGPVHDIFVKIQE